MGALIRSDVHYCMGREHCRFRPPTVRNGLSICVRIALAHALARATL